MNYLVWLCEANGDRVLETEAIQAFKGRNVDDVMAEKKWTYVDFWLPLHEAVELLIVKSEGAATIKWIEAEVWKAM